MIRVLASGALAAALASLGGCGSRAEDAEDLAAPDCTPVPTPAGLFPKACVIGVPNGASVATAKDGTTVVTLNGVVIATYPPCPCPR